MFRPSSVVVVKAPRYRAVAIVVLLSCFAGLCVWYGSLDPAPQKGAYPGEDELIQSYEHYVGKQVAIVGRVRTVDPVTVQIEGPDGATRRLAIEGTPDVEVGQKIRVYGIAHSGGTVRSLNTVTVPTGGVWYTWSVSSLAGLWVLWRIIRHWRIDTTDWTLKPRVETLRLREHIGVNE